MFLIIERKLTIYKSRTSNKSSSVEALLIQEIVQIMVPLKVRDTEGFYSKLAKSIWSLDTALEVWQVGDKRRRGEEEKRRRGEEEKRRRGEEEKRRRGEEEKRRRGKEEKRRRGEEEEEEKRRRGRRRRGGEERRGVEEEEC